MALRSVLKKVYLFSTKNLLKIFGNRNYQKFVIITRSRTGSNFFISLLNSHPALEGHGEVYGNLAGQSVQEIWDGVFSKKGNWVSFVGFKIFYYHPMDSDDRSIWDKILADKSIKIIHLVRENMLRTYVSREIAGKLDVWAQKENSKKFTTEEKKIEVDIEACIAEFSKIKEWESNAQKQFSGHDSTILKYEDLVADNQGKMNEIFNFFGVPEREVASKLKKQNPETVQDLVTNYEELKPALEKAGYGYLID